VEGTSARKWQYDNFICRFRVTCHQRSIDDRPLWNVNKPNTITLYSNIIPHVTTRSTKKHIGRLVISFFLKPLIISARKEFNLANVKRYNLFYCFFFDDLYQCTNKIIKIRNKTRGLLFTPDAFFSYTSFVIFYIFIDSYWHPTYKSTDSNIPTRSRSRGIYIDRYASVFTQDSLVSSHWTVIDEGPTLEVLTHLMPHYDYGFA